MSTTTETIAQMGRHAHMDFADTVEFLITGGVVVYGTLTLLAVLGMIGGKIFVWLENRYGNVDDPEARREERERRLEEEREQQRVIVAISAAIAEVVEEPHRVVSFKPTQNSNWSLEGRSQLHSSHRLR